MYSHDLYWRTDIFSKTINKNDKQQHFTLHLTGLTLKYVSDKYLHYLYVIFQFDILPGYLAKNFWVQKPLEASTLAQWKKAKIYGSDNDQKDVCHWKATTSCGMKEIDF